MIQEPLFLADNTYRGRLLSGTALALLFAAAPLGSAQAQCVIAANVITCDGDISPGFAPTGTLAVDTLTIGGLTSDVTGFGFRIRDTSSSDVTFNTDFGAFGIDLTNGSTAQRNGFHIITDGSITGFLDADISGQVANDTTNASVFVSNFAAFGLDAGTGIDVQNTGTIDISLPTVSRVSTFDRADVVTGRFAAIRAESESGDITIDNDASVTIDGGQRVASNTRTGGTAGTRSIDFTNAVSDIAAISAQGNGALVIDQAGDITVSGGGADLSATTVDAAADVGGEHATTSGIYVPAFFRTGGVFDPTLPRFETVDIDVTGNVQVTGGDVSLNAAVGSSGGAVGEAIIDIGIGGPEASGIRVGAENTIGNGQAIDLSVNGDIMVTGGKAIGTATASDGGAGETAGRVFALVRGQDAVGVHLLADRGPDLDLPTEIDAVVNGNVTVFGGDASVATAGSGTGDVTLNRPVPNTNFEAEQRSSAGGGNAIGLRFMRMTDRSSFSITGVITVGGGSAESRHTGTNGGLGVSASGGSSTGLSLGVGRDDAPHTDSLDVDINLVGPNVRNVASGDGALARIFSSAQRGLSMSFAGDGSQLTYSGDVNYTAGTLSLEATDGAFVDIVDAGLVVGVNTFIFAEEAETPEGTFIYDGTIDFTGGDISVSGNLSPSRQTVPNSTNLAANSDRLVGQRVFGVVGSVSSFGGSPTIAIDHRGIIDLTAGSGPAGLGQAVGINLDGSFFPDLNGRATISGGIDITGGDRVLTLGTEGFSQESAGVLAEVSGLAEIDVDGGTVNANGNGVAGIQANSAFADIMVRNGGSVTATGADAAGIELGSFIDFQNFFTSADQIFASSTNMITVGPNGSVVSNDFIAIHDRSAGIFRSFDTDTRTPTSLLEATENATIIDIAGTVEGGNGTAIDLGSGADTAIFRQTAVITGNTLLGAGEDRFLYQGFTEANPVDGGDDRDRVVVNAASGADDMFDPTVNIPNFTNFEAITKTGTGVLTINGVPFADALDFEVDEGLGVVGTDQPNIGVIVASGAAFRTDQIVGDITNLAGGLVQGTGTSGNFTNSGIFSPGNSIGAFAVTGDLVLGADGTLAVEIEAPDQADLVKVDGTTTLGGTLAVTGIGALTAFADGQAYTIIDSAGAVSGAFADVTDNLPDFDVVPEIVDATGGGQDVVLGLDLAMSGMSDKSVVPNAQQAQIKTGRVFAGTLEDRMAGAGNGRIAVLDDGTLNAYTPRSKPRALTALGGIYNAYDGLGGAVVRPVRTAWFSGLGGFGQADATALAPSYQNDIYGVAAGIDFERKAEGFDWIIGGAAGYTASNVTSGAGSSDVHTFHIGAYGRIDRGPARLSAQLSYGFQSYDFTRVIPVGPTTATATGSADGQLFTAALKGAYDLAPRLGWGQEYGLRVAPAAALGYVYTRRDGFTEAGAGILNQAYGADVFERGYLRTGVEQGAVMALDNGMTFRPHGGLHWEWGFGDDNIVATSTAPAVPGSAFSSPGAIESDGGLIVEAGFELDISETVSAQTNYEGAFSDTGDGHRFSTGFKVRF